eukprot:508203-Hanusia_phi.AAC.1
MQREAQHGEGGDREDGGKGDRHCNIVTQDKSEVDGGNDPGLDKGVLTGLHERLTDVVSSIKEQGLNLCAGKGFDWKPTQRVTPCRSTLTNLTNLELGSNRIRVSIPARLRSLSFDCAIVGDTRGLFIADYTTQCIAVSSNRLTLLEGLASLKVSHLNNLDIDPSHTWQGVERALR